MSSNKLVEALLSGENPTPAPDPVVFTKPVQVGPSIQANINCALGILQVYSEEWGDTGHFLLNSSDGSRETWSKLGATAVLALTRKVLERNGVALNNTFELGAGLAKFAP